MNKNLNYALIFGVVLQFVALIWYTSKVDSRVNILYDKFEKENEASVVENQVKMKVDLENLMEDMKAIKKEIRQANKKDREIMEQHEDIYRLLQESGNSSSSYSYGD